MHNQRTQRTIGRWCMERYAAKTTDAMASPNASIPEMIFEPFGGSVRWIVRVVAPMQLAIVCLMAIVLSDGITLAFVCCAFVCSYWLIYELFVLWYRRHQKYIFLNGERAEAVVAAKQFIYRGGYYRITIEFDAEDHRIRSSAAVGNHTAMNHNVGDPIHIRYLVQQPRWWVPAVP